MESRKEDVFRMISLKDRITDVELLQGRVIYIEGFAFTSLANIDNPANVFDAIIIKTPPHVQCFTPKLTGSSRSLEEHIEFINQHQLTKAVVIADDLHFLKNCPSLQYLQIIPADTCECFDYSPVYDMPNLLGLNCATEFGPHLVKHTTFDYSQVPNIVDLDIAGTGNLHTNKLDALQRLNVSRNPAKLLPDIVSSSSLKWLSITECGIRTLEGLNHIAPLADISLWYNRSLSDASEIVQFSNSLCSLAITACPRIKDFSFLGALKNLRHLQLLGSNNLPDLSFLANMKKLTHFVFDMNVEDGDLSNCLSIPYVCSLRNRKHYNLRDQDLPKYFP